MSAEQRAACDALTKENSGRHIQPPRWLVSPCGLNRHMMQNRYLGILNRPMLHPPYLCRLNRHMIQNRYLGILNIPCISLVSIDI